MTETVVTLTVVTDDPAQVARVTEAFARVATGLALDGVPISLNLMRSSDVEEHSD